MAQESILLVDNDEQILFSLAHVLEMEGYDVRTATLPSAALQLMQNHSPQLVISDIQMPEMDGYQFYAQVRENSAWHNIPFIFLSGKQETKFLRQSYASGADMFLPKTVAVDDLCAVIKARLQRARELQSAADHQLEKTKKELLRIFSHELRTPLSHIHGFLSFLEDGAAPEPHILRPMRSGVDRLAALIDDLLLVFELENQDLAQVLDEYGEPLQLRAVIVEAVMALAEPMKEKQIAIRNRLRRDYTVWGLNDSLQDVFYRVLDNALKFSDEHSEVIVTDRSYQERVEILIIDQGVGISAKNHTSILQKFSQIDRQKQEQQGVGLGLAITERLLKLHGGQISLESNEHGGTTVSILLPRLA